jgi:hypothetical protein
MFINCMNNLKIIDEITKKINIKYINTDIIKNNIDKIYKNILIPYKKIYNNLILPYKINITNDEYEKIIKIIKNSELVNYKAFDNYFNKIITFKKLMCDNITLYYPSNNDENNIISLKLFKIIKTMLINSNFTDNYIIIWLPIDKKRNFSYNIINDNTLQNSINNFEAFSISGFTNNNLTVLTRIEEIEKLTIHEIIHGLNIDCSDSKNLNQIINKYHNNKSKKNYTYTYDIYESYTELLSSYIYLTFKNINLNEKEFKKIMYQQILFEIIYSNNIVCNLIKLNNKTIDEFIKEPSFKGELCFYEYYYLKSNMYNNFVLDDDFLNNKNCIKIYSNINTNINNDLLVEVYKNMIKTNNFKYMYF